MNERITRRLVIHGRVQGVGFRWSLCSLADELGLRGWVRNRSDGSVEALVHGSTASVEALTAWAMRGPVAARVERVDVADSCVEAPGFGDRFEQLANG